MTTELKPPIKAPTKKQLKKAEALANRIIRENKEWLREMADK
jgi:hypothetical protein